MGYESAKPGSNMEVIWPGIFRRRDRHEAKLNNREGAAEKSGSGGLEERYCWTLGGLGMHVDWNGIANEQHRLNLPENECLATSDINAQDDQQQWLVISIHSREVAG